MNIFNHHRTAFEKLHAIKNSVKDSDIHATRNATLNLAHHLRAHGLSATLGYGLESDEETQKITQIFIDALHKTCPISGQSHQDKAQSLKTEAAATYLLHSRLALPLADGFALAAKAFWPTEDSTPKHTEQETAHG